MGNVNRKEAQGHLFVFSNRSESGSTAEVDRAYQSNVRIPQHTRGAGYFQQVVEEPQVLQVPCVLA